MQRTANQILTLRTVRYGSFKQSSTCPAPMLTTKSPSIPWDTVGAGGGNADTALVPQAMCRYLGKLQRDGGVPAIRSAITRDASSTACRSAVTGAFFSSEPCVAARSAMECPNAHCDSCTSRRAAPPLVKQCTLQIADRGLRAQYVTACSDIYR